MMAAVFCLWEEGRPTGLLHYRLDGLAQPVKPAYDNVIVKMSQGGRGRAVQTRLLGRARSRYRVSRSLQRLFSRRGRVGGRHSDAEPSDCGPVLTPPLFE